MYPSLRQYPTANWVEERLLRWPKPAPSKGQQAAILIHVNVLGERLWMIHKDREDPHMLKSAPQHTGQETSPDRAERKGRAAWYVGAGVVAIGVLIAAYEMLVVGTPAPMFLELMILLGIPAIYLSLMYVSLTKK